jgi:hypothetical protein
MTDEHTNVSITILDSTGQKIQKSSVVATYLPSQSTIRELISYVPTTRNLATRGHLTGIPYLGDKFDDDDQQIINSISGESMKTSKNVRSRKNNIHIER